MSIEDHKYIGMKWADYKNSEFQLAKNISQK